jgi:hypothetical protein
METPSECVGTLCHYRPICVLLVSACQFARTLSGEVARSPNHMVACVYYVRIIIYVLLSVHTWQGLAKQRLTGSFYICDVQKVKYPAPPRNHITHCIAIGPCGVCPLPPAYGIYTVRFTIHEPERTIPTRYCRPYHFNRTRYSYSTVQYCIV